MRIAQLNTYDFAGGAERVSRELHREYARRGEDSWLLVGCKRGSEEGVVEIPNTSARSRWARTWSAVANAVAPLHHGQITPLWKVRRSLTRAIGEPDRSLARALGREDFDFPGSRRLSELMPWPPAVIHAHNLHGGVLPDGGYFDLRLLPALSRSRPFVLTLHDAWLLSGHCGHSFDCPRWEIGCGQCPDLTIYPAVRRDATAWNWQRKYRIYSQSTLYVATPCTWLMQRVERSMLWAGVAEARVIPYGVDRKVFRPATDPDGLRAELGFPPGARILLFAANGIRENEWKDFRTLRAAVALVAERLRDDVVFVALGERAPSEHFGRAEIRFVPYERDDHRVARYYQASHLYVHAALAETFPNSILEALACGVPVVASAVGGVPEQVNPIERRGWTAAAKGGTAPTGALVEASDPNALANAIELCLDDESFRRELAANAAADAANRFDLERQVDDYLTWYDELVEGREDGV
jgi:glycosyltransferase involved in cell wall biosynthesis